MKPVLLIADDEAEIRQAVALFVESEYEICYAADGNEALNLLREGHIDILLTDFNMPGLNGLDLINAMRDLGAAVPTVMLTGRGSDELRCQVAQYEPSATLEKPFHPNELRQTLRRCLAVASSLR